MSGFVVGDSAGSACNSADRRAVVGGYLRTERYAVSHGASGGISSRYAESPGSADNVAGTVAVFYQCAALVCSGYAAGEHCAGNIDRAIAVLYVSATAGNSSGDTADLIIAADGSVPVETVVNLALIPSGNAADTGSAGYRCEVSAVYYRAEVYSGNAADLIVGCVAVDAASGGEGTVVYRSGIISGYAAGKRCTASVLGYRAVGNGYVFHRAACADIAEETGITAGGYLGQAGDGFAVPLESQGIESKANG